MATLVSWTLEDLMAQPDETVTDENNTVIALLNTLHNLSQSSELFVTIRSKRIQSKTACIINYQIVNLSIQPPGTSGEWEADQALESNTERVKKKHRYASEFDPETESGHLPSTEQRFYHG